MLLGSGLFLPFSQSPNLLSHLTPFSPHSRPPRTESVRKSYPLNATHNPMILLGRLTSLTCLIPLDCTDNTLMTVNIVSQLLAFQSLTVLLHVSPVSSAAARHAQVLLSSGHFSHTRRCMANNKVKQVHRHHHHQRNQRVTCLGAVFIFRLCSDNVGDRSVMRRFLVYAKPVVDRCKPCIKASCRCMWNMINTAGDPGCWLLAAG